MSKIVTGEAWNEAWDKYFSKYQSDLRNAYYVGAFLNDKNSSILEIAAGSFRDVAELNNLGFDCSGADFSSRSVDLAKSRNLEISNKIFNENAFEFSFSDKSFDVTYHNGFWVLFEDEAIKKLAQEQARITKNKVIVTVHNAHNVDFKNYFQYMKAVEPIYDIRFFYVDEIYSIMKMFFKNIQVIPVGKAKKSYEDILVCNGVKDMDLIRKEIIKNKHNLKLSERLMCIADL